MAGGEGVVPVCLGAACVGGFAFGFGGHWALGLDFDLTQHR